MRPRYITVLTILLGPSWIAGSAAASIAQCTSPGEPPAVAVFPLTVIPDALAYFDGSCAGTGVAGGGASCPVVAIVQSGAWCGPPYLPNVSMTCIWHVLPGSAVVDLVVGFDTNGDGDVGAADPVAVRAKPFLQPVILDHAFSFTTPAAGGRLVVYPIARTAGGAPGALTFLTCV